MYIDQEWKQHSLSSFIFATNAWFLCPWLALYTSPCSKTKLTFQIYLFVKQAEEAAGPEWAGIGAAMGHSQAGTSSEAAGWASGKQGPASRHSIAANSSFLNWVKNSLHYGGIFKKNN